MICYSEVNKMGNLLFRIFKDTNEASDKDDAFKRSKRLEELSRYCEKHNATKKKANQSYCSFLEDLFYNHHM